MACTRDLVLLLSVRLCPEICTSSKDHKYARGFIEVSPDFTHLYCELVLMLTHQWTLQMCIYTTCN